MECRAQLDGMSESEQRMGCEDNADTVRIASS